MHPRFTIAHMMLAIAIVALLLAGVTLISMDSVVGLIAFLTLATPIWLIASEMRSDEGRTAVALSDLGVQAVCGGRRLLIDHLFFPYVCVQINNI